jgi:hypothetical protein
MEDAHETERDDPANAEVARGPLASKALLRLLPPLPSPDYRTLRGEYLWCAACVGGVTAFCVGVAHALTAAAMQHCSAAVRDGCLYAIYAQSGLAVVCLAALHLIGPGTVRRSAKNCLPLPPAVLAALRTDAPDWASLQHRGHNIAASSSEPRTYCVRCFVWRPAPREVLPAPTGRVGAALASARALLCEGHGRAHHCSSCNSCVRDSDHHCSVLGCCVSGRNVAVFYCLVLLCATGPLTALGAIPLTAAACSGGWWVALLVAAALAACVGYAVRRCLVGDVLDDVMQCTECLGAVGDCPGSAWRRLRGALSAAGTVVGARSPSGAAPTCSWTRDEEPRL